MARLRQRACEPCDGGWGLLPADGNAAAVEGDAGDRGERTHPIMLILHALGEAKR